jgi:hypothetical protein
MGLIGVLDVDECDSEFMVVWGRYEKEIGLMLFIEQDLIY